MYGLKQAPRAWFERPLLIYLLLYVDDIIVTSNDASQVHNLIATLGQVFELKDLGHLNYFLGIQITQSSCGLTLTQTSDVLQMYFTIWRIQNLLRLSHVLPLVWFLMMLSLSLILLSTGAWLVLFNILL